MPTRASAGRAALRLLLGWLLAAEVAGAQTLPPPIKLVTDGHKLPASAYSLYVREIGGAEPLLSINPELSLNPASAVKIIPTLAALELLGPAFRWKTEAYALGTIKNGVLHGDLLLKGYGDPHLVTEEFWKLTGELRRRGLKDIKGDLLIDDSYFSVPPEDAGAFDNKPHRTYNVPPNALLVNFKAVFFHFYPAANGRKVVVRPAPQLPNLTIENRLRLRKRGCWGFQRGVAVAIPDARRADRVIFEGRFPTGCEHYILSRSVLTHQTFAFGVFKALWEQAGGSLAGQVKTATAPEAAKPFLVWHSKPLAEVIKLVNKLSNNVMSRQLLLTIGAELAGPPGTIENSIGAVEAHLAGAGLDARSLTLVNGAGLSRDTRISARLLAQILAHAWSLPHMPEFISSLSIVGMDGTAKHRLKTKQASGYAHVKTGTIDHVSAVAGYVMGRSGKRHIVAGMLNHHDAHRGAGKELMNALVAWAHAQ